MVSIRRFREFDWPAVWPILRTTFEAGDTYAFSPDSTEAEIHQAWVEAPSATYVACAPDGHWKRLGFAVVGTLPHAFRHLRLGYVDALVMFKELSA